MSERIVYLFHDPRHTGHEIKWGAGGGFAEGWIHFQQDIKEQLEQLVIGKRRQEIIALLQEREMRYEEWGDGTLVVWLDKTESLERRQVKELESGIAKAIRRQMGSLRKSHDLLKQPSEQVIAQMAKAAMAVYLAKIDHPVIWE